MALYVELDATASNGEQYWYDQYTVGEPRIAAAVSAVQNSTSTSGSYVATLSSGVSVASSSMFSNPEILLSPVASVVEANSTFINNGNITSSSGIVQFPESETIAAGVALPLVRKVFGQIAAKEFVSVQPMNLPSGLVFYLDFQYGTNKQPYTAGSSVYGATGGNTPFGNTNTGGFYGAGRFTYSINNTSSAVHGCK